MPGQHPQAPTRQPVSGWRAALALGGLGRELGAAGAALRLCGSLSYGKGNGASAGAQAYLNIGGTVRIIISAKP